jgi:DNA-binding response OmpR family regulator
MPVLLLTAKDSVEDRVRGLDAGGDDYLIKPFAFPELLARVRALTRRGGSDVDATFDLCDLHMDIRRRMVARAGRPLELTAREFELLEYLLRNRGGVVSREMLARDVWKIQGSTALDNVIDVQIGRLRKKIDDPYERKLLHTIRGVGFALREEQP